MQSELNELRRQNIIQGEFQVVDDPNVVLTTLLGSCVAACLMDREAKVGGMNHFLLPGDDRRDGDAESYGVHLMELLVNGLLKRGAQRSRLEAKIFGGARMVEGLSDIGARNGAFARDFLGNEGIRIVAADIGGTRGRRIEFYAVNGRVRQSFLADIPKAQPAKPATHAEAGAVDLF